MKQHSWCTVHADRAACPHLYDAGQLVNLGPAFGLVHSLHLLLAQLQLGGEAVHGFVQLLAQARQAALADMPGLDCPPQGLGALYAAAGGAQGGGVGARGGPGGEGTQQAAW